MFVLPISISHFVFSYFFCPTAEQFGTHSLRIGGATALFAMGADETVIRTMGRWSSDIHRLYVRACFERCKEWTKMAGSAQVTDVARIFDDGEGDMEDDDA